MFKIWSFGLLAMVVVLGGNAWAQSNTRDAGQICLPVLIPNEIKDQSHGDSNIAFRNAFCGKWNSDHSSDQGFSSGGNYLEVFSGNLSGHSNSRSVDGAQFCSDKSLVATQSVQISYWSSTVGDKARGYFVDCVKDIVTAEARSQLPLVVSEESSGDDVLVRVSWNANSGLPSRKFSDVTADNLICTTPKTMHPGTRIPSIQPTIITCKWINDFVSNGSITVNTTEGMSASALAVRQITTLGKLALELSHTETQVTASKKVCSGLVTNDHGRNSRVGPVYVTVNAEKPPVAWHDIATECTVNPGSCHWNGIDKPGGFVTLQDTPTTLQVLRNVGGDPLQFRVCAIEDEQSQVVVPVRGPEQDAVRNTTISFMIPSGQSGQIIFTSEQGAVSSIPVGNSVAPFFLTTQSDVPGGRGFTYLIRESRPTSAEVSLTAKRPRARPTVLAH